MNSQTTITMRRVGMFKLGSLILLAGLFFMLPASGTAQNWFSGLTYDVSVPSGDLKNFTDPESWRGVGLTYRRALSEDMTAGLWFGWHVFYERTSETLQLRNGALTGTQDRYVNSFPMMLNFHFYMGESGKTRPYIGLNGGGYFVSQRFEVGIAALTNDEFQWGIAPEVGVVIPLDRRTMLLLEGKYNIAMTGDGIAGRDFKVEYWGLSVGFAWSQY